MDFTLTPATETASGISPDASLIPAVLPIVDRVRSKYGVSGDGMTESDFFRICDGEGIVLAKTQEFSNIAEFEQIYGGYIRLDNGARLIYLRSFFLSSGFDRFTAAHELGHHFMPSVERPSVLFSAEGAGYELNEQKADLFAELMTMPMC